MTRLCKCIYFQCLEISGDGNLPPLPRVLCTAARGSLRSSGEICWWQTGNSSFIYCTAKILNYPPTVGLQANISLWGCKVTVLCLSVVRMIKLSCFVKAALCSFQSSVERILVLLLYCGLVWWLLQTPEQLCLVSCKPKLPQLGALRPLIHPSPLPLCLWVSLSCFHCCCHWVTHTRSLCLFNLQTTHHSWVLRCSVCLTIHVHVHAQSCLAWSVLHNSPNSKNSTKNTHIISCIDKV